MAGNCGQISDDILNDCDETVIGGVRDRLILFNKDDIDGKYTKNVLNPQIIEDITLATSPAKRGFVYEGQNNSNDVSANLSKGAYSGGYIHKIIFRIFGNGPEIKAQLEALAKGKTVAIIQNNFKGAADQAAFELFGMDSGLEVLEMITDKSDADTQGAYVVTLQTNEKYKEGHLPATILDTDFNTTLAMINSLI